MSPSSLDQYVIYSSIDLFIHPPMHLHVHPHTRTSIHPTGHDWSPTGFPTHSSTTLFIRHLLGEQNLGGLCLEWWLKDSVWSVTLTSLGNTEINDGVLDVKSRMRVFGSKSRWTAGMCSFCLDLCAWWVWQGCITQSIDKVLWFWQGVKQRCNTN